MAGNKAGGAKAAATNIARYGKNHYKEIGKIGGSAPKSRPAGFAAMPREFRVAAGKKGGAVSRRKPSSYYE
jgi:general stress protein YciG